MAISEHRNPHKGKWDPREFTFLEAFYGNDPATKGNQEASIVKAGWAPLVGQLKARRILKHFGDASASASLNAVGVNKPYLALRIRHVLENGSDKEILAAARLAYALLGESTDERGGGVTVNSTAPVMVVVGASKERIAALRSATPQPSREELERLQNERVQSKLARLKQGETLVKHPHSVARENAYEGRWERQQATRSVELATSNDPERGTVGTGHSLSIPALADSKLETIDVEAPIPVQPSSPASDD